MSNQEFITKEEKVKLEKELHELESTRRKEILEALEFAKSLGDLSENAEYHQARDAQGRNEARIQEIHAILKTAQVSEGGSKDGVVGVGSSVTVEKTKTGDKKEYHLVGADEADMSQSRLSYKSPLGEALMNHKKGDVVLVKTPNGEIEYKISKVV